MASADPARNVAGEQPEHAYSSRAPRPILGDAMSGIRGVTASAAPLSAAIWAKNGQCQWSCPVMLGSPTTMAMRRASHGQRVVS